MLCLHMIGSAGDSCDTAPCGRGRSREFVLQQRRCRRGIPGLALTLRQLLRALAPCGLSPRRHHRRRISIAALLTHDVLQGDSR